MLTRNYVQLIGNLGRDPQILATGDGAEFATLSIATSDHWKDRDSGELQTRTHWHRVVVFAPGLVAVMKEQYSKGQRVMVEGQLRTREYEKDGSRRYATEILVQGYAGTVRHMDAKAGATLTETIQ